MPGVDVGAVFSALADPTRREVVRSLASQPGLTASLLAGELPMTRQAVAKHLGILEEANLVAVQWAGREKRHFINPVPINQISERWIGKFELPRMRVLSDLKASLEKKTAKEK